MNPDEGGQIKHNPMAGIDNRRPHRKPRMVALIFLVIFVVLIGVTAMSVYSWQHAKVEDLNNNVADLKSQAAAQRSAESDKIQTDKFQAVFLEAGQVYFGKLSVVDDKTYQLSDTYYLSQDSKTIVKLGNEPHMPQDKLYIQKSNVQLWENLKSASQFNGQLK